MRLADQASLTQAKMQKAILRILAVQIPNAVHYVSSTQQATFASLADIGDPAYCVFQAAETKMLYIQIV